MNVTRALPLNALVVEQPIAHSPQPAYALNPQEWTDVECLKRIQLSKGTETAGLEVLFARHSGPLLKFLIASSGSQDAEDLVHDAFLHLAAHADSYRGASAVRTWLFTIALNLLRSRYRHQAVKRKNVEGLEQAGAQKSSPLQPEQSALQAERQRLVQRAISELGVAEREAFLLYWYGELTHSEISNALNISISAAKVRVHRAFKSLEHALEDCR